MEEFYRIRRLPPYVFEEVNKAKAKARNAGADIIDLGDRTLLPGLIDVHVHLFLHPGAEDLQTIEESVPQRTILATLAARDDLMAGFTAERDMGTEGAGSAGAVGTRHAGFPLKYAISPPIPQTGAERIPRQPTRIGHCRSSLSRDKISHRPSAH